MQVFFAMVSAAISSNLHVKMNCRAVGPGLLGPPAPMPWR